MTESQFFDPGTLALDILQDIKSAIERIRERTKAISSPDDFGTSSNGEMALESVCMLLIAVGESLKNLDKVTGGQLLPTYPSIPWKNVKGLRDIIVHHYFDVDAGQIWWIVSHEITPLEQAIDFFIEKLSFSSLSANVANEANEPK